MRTPLASLLFVLALTQVALAQQDIPQLPAVKVIAPTPLPAGTGGIDPQNVPSTTHSLTGADFVRGGAPTMADVLFQRLPGFSLSDPNGNSSAQEIRYRGFSASPLQGRPQGLAVYMNGIRINEAFGDTVNWDLIPTNAIDRVDVWSGNPVFGLNALGGAISLQLKNGFTHQGVDGELMGGSFGRMGASLSYGVQKGDVAFFLAAQGMRDDGWRDKSPTEIARFYADVGWRNDRAELHVSGGAAASSYGAAAATPRQLLDFDYRSVYTTPQTTENEMAWLALNGTYALTDTWSLQANLYGRAFRQVHVDGNAGEFERCSNASSPQFINRLCLEDDGFPRPNPVTTAFRDQFAILDQNNNPIPCPPSAGNGCAPVPYGTIDRTQTKATTLGLSLQTTTTEDLGGHPNNFVLGASYDRSTLNFTARSTLGFIHRDFTVTTGAPAIPGLGSIIHTAGDAGLGSVDINATTTYWGMWAVDTFEMTDKWTLTFGGRVNIAQVSVRDQFETNAELNSDTTYSKFNPLIGLAYKIVPGFSAFASYSESNRVPTPLENACSNRSRPCLVESFLVSDPPLKQVVAKTYEGGLRGNMPVTEGRVEWKMSAFRTDSTDDIVHLASVIQGRGFFQNVAATQRQGIEGSFEFRSSRWHAYVNASFLDATYQFTGFLPSPNNPFADGTGNVRVNEGKRIPGIPREQGKFGLSYAVTPKWKIGGDMVVVGNQYYVGDDANQNPKLPGYWVLNVHTSYDITKNVQLFALANNVFDERYALFGTFWDPASVSNVPLAFPLTDRRIEVYGAPLAGYAGIRVRF